MTLASNRVDVAQSWLNFDIQGFAGVRVGAQATSVRQLTTTLAYFATDQQVPADIVVTPFTEPMPEAGWLERDVAYTDRALLFQEKQVQIVRSPEAWHIHGSGDLLTSLVPVLDRCMVERNVAMIHAATMSYHNHGIALLGAEGAARTTVIAKLLKQPGFDFVGDRWGFLDGDGRIRSGKPMFIAQRSVAPRVVADVREPAVSTALSRPAGKLSTGLNAVVARYPRLAHLSHSRPSQRPTMVPSTTLPSTNVTTKAGLAAVIYIEAYDGAVTRLIERSEGWMVDRMIGNFHIELAEFSKRVVAAMGASNLVSTTRHFLEKANVLASALDGVPCLVLRVPRVFGPDTASDDVVAVLSQLMPNLVRADSDVPHQAHQCSSGTTG